MEKDKKTNRYSNGEELKEKWTHRNEKNKKKNRYSNGEELKEK